MADYQAFSGDGGRSKETDPASAQDEAPKWAVTATALLAGLKCGLHVFVNTALLPRLTVLLQLDVQQTTLFSGCMYLGVLIGVLLAATLSDYIGRKATVVIGELLNLFGTVGQLILLSLVSITSFRVASGVGLGISLVTTPIYIGELAPRASRGAAVAVFAVGYSLAMTVEHVLETALPAAEKSLESWVGQHGWRLIIGTPAVPVAFVLGLVHFALPHSPVWLQGQAEQERVVVIAHPSDVRRGATGPEAALLQQSRAEAKDARKDSWAFCQALVTTVVLVVAYQLTFISTTTSYTLDLLALLGCPVSHQQYYAFVVAGVHVAGVLLALPCIDHYGRRVLLLGGLCGVAVMLSTLALMMVAHPAPQNWRAKIGILLAAVAAFQVGPGACFLVITAEIFPTRHRATGAALGVGLLMSMVFFTTTLWPIYVTDDNTLRLYLLTGAVVAAVCCGVLAWALPETKAIGLGASSAADMWAQTEKDREGEYPGDGNETDTSVTDL